MMVFIVRHERGNQVGCFRFKYPFYFILIVYTLISWSFLSFLIVLESSFSNYTLVFWISADKNFTAPNFNFVSEPDITRILRFKIFIHMDGQLCPAHVILGYKPILASFQYPKYVIKAKDPQLRQINIVVPRFLASPPPEGTHQVELPTQIPRKKQPPHIQLLKKKQLE